MGRGLGWGTPEGPASPTVLGFWGSVALLLPEGHTGTPPTASRLRFPRVTQPVFPGARVLGAQLHAACCACRVLCVPCSPLLLSDVGTCKAPAPLRQAGC